MLLLAFTQSAAKLCLQADKLRQRTQTVRSVHAIPGAAAHFNRTAAQRPKSNPPRSGKGSTQSSREPSPINTALAGPARPKHTAAAGAASLTAQARPPARPQTAGSYSFPKEPARLQAPRSTSSASPARSAGTAAGPVSQDSSKAASGAQRPGATATAPMDAREALPPSRNRPASAPSSGASVEGKPAGASKPAFGSCQPRAAASSSTAAPTKCAAS